MNYPITRTKIILPRRHPDLLSRPRLLGMLDDLLEYRLTLITAPAGYGKTSLLVDLASKQAYPVCWLAIDPLDADLLRFLQYFIAAIRQVFPAFGLPSSSLVSDLEGSEPDQEQILGTIVNDLYDHIEEHFILVLDDFHLIDHSEPVNQFLSDLIQAVDENCHLVIASRSLISLPDLPLMVGRSYVKGLSFEELAFLPEEIRALYQNKYHQEMSSREAQQLAAETEGWITGLLLSAETTRNGATKQERAIRAAGVDLYDYLAQQVLEEQSLPLQDFLLRTSVLEEFNEALCRQALDPAGGEGDWGALIEELLAKNLFIQPVENGGTWLRYHHLFRDFLQQRFQRQFPGEYQALLEKLVQVYSDSQELEKAYTTCLALGEDQRTANFLEQVSPALLHSGQLSLLKEWLDALPRQVLEKHPGLQIHRAAIFNMAGDSRTGLGILDQLIETQTEETSPNILAQIFIRRATCHRYLGNCRSGQEDALQALELLAGDQEEELLVAGAEREIGLNQLRLGGIQEARSHLKRSLAAYHKLEDRRNAAYMQMDLGLLEMNAGNYHPAQVLFHQVFSIWDQLGNYSQLVYLCNNLGVLAHLTGDFPEAQRWFNQSLEYARQTSNLRGTAYTLASLADLALDLGAFSQVGAYLDQAQNLAEKISASYLLFYIRLVKAALARRCGNLDQAWEEIDALQGRVQDLPSNFERGAYHREKAMLLLAQGRLEDGYEELQAAQEVFAALQDPVQTALVRLHLAGAECQGGHQAAARDGLSAVREILGARDSLTRALMPALAAQPELLACLAEHLDRDPLVRALAREMESFQAALPGLREELGFEATPAGERQPPRLEIRALGRLELRRDGEVVAAPEWTKQRTVRELLYYLLCCPEGASREEICLAFWPDSPYDKLTRQFKNALYRLRRAVGKDAVLYDSLSRLYSFNRDLDYWFDVEAFEGAAAQAEAEEDPDQRHSQLEKAVGLYRHPFGPTLEGLWVEAFRYQLYLVFERILIALAEGQLARKQPQACLVSAETLLEITPGQEEAWRLAMAAYGARSDRAGIERTYQRCQEALAADLDAAPSPETEALYQQLMNQG